MQKILVSRCLLGHRVRYDGGASGPFDQLQQWIAEGRVVPADQRFGADQFLGLQAPFGLVIQADVACSE